MNTYSVRITYVVQYAYVHIPHLFLSIELFRNMITDAYIPGLTRPVFIIVVAGVLR